MASIFPPRHIVWSTDRIDLDDPFQLRWYLRQVILHGRAEDIRDLNLEEVKQELDGLDLPPDLYQLWKKFQLGVLLDAVLRWVHGSIPYFYDSLHRLRDE